MIFDHIDNWSHYTNQRNAEQAFHFLTHLQPDCELGEYPLPGKSVFARAMEYHSLTQADAVCEAHRAFVDIQIVLKGTEYIDVFNTGELETKTPYNKETDVELFHRPKRSNVRVYLSPGHFAMLFPHDAHSPQIMTGASAELVKKVVVKVHVDILAGRHPDHD